MKDNKYITRFMASVTLMAIAYGGFISLKQAAQAGETVRPLLHLTTGEVVDPATAPEVTKFNNSTAAEFAQMVFGDAEEAPDINEFLSRFTCSTCGKKCLLASPRCTVGRTSQEKATSIYQEMFPEVELFQVGEQFYSLL